MRDCDPRSMRACDPWSMRVCGPLSDVEKQHVLRDYEKQYGMRSCLNNKENKKNPLREKKSVSRHS